MDEIEMGGLVNASDELDPVNSKYNCLTNSMDKTTLESIRVQAPTIIGFPNKQRYTDIQAWLPDKSKSKAQ